MGVIRGAGECWMTIPCNGCATVLPRYLCAACVVSTGQSGDLSRFPCGTLCCQDIEFRLGGGVVTSGSDMVCGWAGQGTCQNIKSQFCSIPYSVFIKAGVHKDSSGKCYTEIECPDLLPYPIQVDGTMGKDFCSFTFGGDSLSSGAHVVVTLTAGGGVVPNKSAGLKCAPCSCGTCVPTSYCVMIFIPASEIYGADPDCGGFWDTHTMSCTPTTGSATQQWTDKSGKPFEIGGVPYTVTMHTPSQAEVDGGYQSCAIITRISLQTGWPSNNPANTQEYSRDIPPSQIYDYNEIGIALDAPAFPPPDPTMPTVGKSCIERVGDAVLTRGGGAPGQQPISNMAGMHTFTNTDQNGTLKRLDGSTMGLYYIVETCCGTPCVPPVTKCWTGCRELITKYGSELNKCLGVPLYATIIAPGNAYDGKVIPMLTNPVLPNDILTSGAFTASFCVQWAGQLSFVGSESCTGPTADAQSPINLSFLLRYNDPHKCEGPIPDDPGGYRLIYSLGRTWCGSAGLPGMRGNDNLTPDGDGIGIGPTYAACAPFRLDFSGLPGLCCGYRVGGLINSTQPKYVGDAGGSFTVRITQ